MSQVHTPTPWRVGIGTIWVPPTQEEQERDGKDGYIAAPYVVASVDAQADAERIALCVNLHDELLAACVTAMTLESSIDQEAWYASAEIPNVFRQIAGALAKAKGT